MLTKLLSFDGIIGGFKYRLGSIFSCVIGILYYRLKWTSSSIIQMCDSRVKGTYVLVCKKMSLRRSRIKKNILSDIILHFLLHLVQTFKLRQMSFNLFFYAPLLKLWITAQAFSQALFTCTLPAKLHCHSTMIYQRNLTFNRSLLLPLSSPPPKKQNKKKSTLSP